MISFASVGAKGLVFGLGGFSAWRSPAEVAGDMWSIASQRCHGFILLDLSGAPSNVFAQHLAQVSLFRPLSDHSTEETGLGTVVRCFEWRSWLGGGTGELASLRAFTGATTHPNSATACSKSLEEPEQCRDRRSLLFGTSIDSHMIAVRATRCLHSSIS